MSHPVFEKNFFISANHMPTGSLDRLSELDARSALGNCKPAFLAPDSAGGAGGCWLSQPAMALYHLVKKSVRNMRRLFVAFIDCSFALNLLTVIHYRIKRHEFNSDPALLIFRQNWCHNTVVLLVTFRINRNVS